jgi:cytidyltransferase-like protein
MIIYTTGVFDLLHKGHINVLTQASALGSLVVGVMSDEGVFLSKNKYPVFSTQERIEQLESLPFVSRVVSYDSTNQIPQYKEIKPDVIVQGDDWFHSADRTLELEYIKKNNVRLILLPRTEGVSTTEIRKRVERSVRRDNDLILNNLSLVKIDVLKSYEEFEESKVLKLVEKIKKEGVFFNPISIVREMVVIDGNNRLEALKRLGCRFVPVVVYHYKDIDLLGNVHYFNNGIKTRLSEFAMESKEKIEFEKRSPDDIFKAIEEKKMIPNGETFHRVPFSVIRLPISLKDLINGFDFNAFLSDRIKNGKIRFYQSNVYVCDEW